MKRLARKTLTPRLHRSWVPPLLFCGAVLFSSCMKGPETTPLSTADSAAVRNVIQLYAAAWMRMDTAAVLDLFTEDALLSPSGLSPRRGKTALRDFWFGDTGSVTTVPSYTIDVLEIGGSGPWAYTYEHGALSFTYTKGAFSMSRSARSYATTIYTKDSTDVWKIRQRMWSDTVLEGGE